MSCYFTIIEDRQTAATGADATSSEEGEAVISHEEDMDADLSHSPSSNIISEQEEDEEGVRK